MSVILLALAIVWTTLGLLVATELNPWNLSGRKRTIVGISLGPAVWLLMSIAAIYRLATWIADRIDP